MTTIEFYQPNTVDCRIQFPTEWDELQTKDLRLVSRAIRYNYSREWLILKIIERRAKDLPRGWEYLIDSESAAIELIPLMDKLLEENVLTRNPIPRYGWLRRFFGPANAFNDITVGEYEDAEHFYLAYNKDNNIRHLHDLMCVLWRRQKKGVRVPYKQHIRGKSSFLIQPHKGTLHLVYLWYAGCRSRLPKLFPNVFDAPEEGAPQDMMAITTLIHYGAGVKNGTRDQIRKTLLKEFLYECELAALQQKEMEEELKKMKTKRR